MSRLGWYRAGGLVSIGFAMMMGLLFTPHVGWTNAHQTQPTIHTVTFSIVNRYNQRICLQGKVDTVPVCVGPYERRSVQEPASFMVNTANFYTRTGLVRFWFGDNKVGVRQMLVKRDATEVDLCIKADGTIHHSGLDRRAGVDLADYITWHGLGDLLNS